MKIGFAGTRHGMTPLQWQSLAWLLNRLEAVDSTSQVHHGDCVGADAEMHEIAVLRGLSVIIHPPNLDRHRARCQGGHARRDPKTYLERNRDIVDETDVLIAAPAEKEEQRWSGTWSTVRYARSKGKKVYLIFPDGGCEEPKPCLVVGATA